LDWPAILLLFLMAAFLFVIGIWAGIVFARRHKPPTDSLDRQQYLTFIRSMANWTSEFAGDVSKVQTQLTGISKQLGNGESVEIAQDVGSILEKMISANEQLQSRLSSAEHRLERQAHELADYLTEAHTDGLTGLANRRAFDKQLDACHRSHVLSGRSFVIVLIDLDHFKNVNDSLGHLVGDKVLRQFADRLRHSFRESFQVARYGGEEFAILMGQSLAQCVEIVERFRQNIEQTPLQVDSTQWRMTLSAGLAEIQKDESSDACVQRADEALYVAKAQGRNRVCVHDGVSTNIRLPEESIASDGTKGESTGRDAASAAANIEREVHRDRLQQRLQNHLNAETQR
jgi:diguanylate cyclase